VAPHGNPVWAPLGSPSAYWLGLRTHGGHKDQQQCKPAHSPPVATHYHFTMAHTTGGSQQLWHHMATSLGALLGSPTPATWHKPPMAVARASSAGLPPCPLVAPSCHLALACPTGGTQQMDQRIYAPFGSLWGSLAPGPCGKPPMVATIASSTPVHPCALVATPCHLALVCTIGGSQQI